MQNENVFEDMLMKITVGYCFCMCFFLSFSFSFFFSPDNKLSLVMSIAKKVPVFFWLTPSKVLKRIGNQRKEVAVMGGCSRRASEFSCF